jgi:hypothetical protein
MSEPTKQTLIVRLRSMGRREKTMAAVLGAIAVLALIFVLLSGGGSTIEGVSSNPVVRTSPSPSVTSSAPPETGQAFEGKDPFQPLVVAVPAGGGGTGGVNGNPGPGGTPAPTPTGSITGVNGGNSSSSAVTVTLIDIRKQSGKLVATVDVNGKDYTASQGQTFANNFQVLSLSSSCGTFVFGDERFSLCIGQQVNK